MLHAIFNPTSGKAWMRRLRFLTGLGLALLCVACGSVENGGREQARASGGLAIDRRYLNLPVSAGAATRRFELVMDGRVTHEFFIALAVTNAPEFYSFLDLADFQGRAAEVRVDSAPASAAQREALVLSNGMVGAETFYREALRPLFHFTARRGWLNDPNGLVYFNGEYHLGYQHNPYGTNWANMHWGHAVSTNLVHWTELPEWLYPDALGAMWSGSAVVDERNSAGFGANALVAIYTGAAKGADPNLPRLAAAGKFTQCLASSRDAGRTWTKFAGNPVLPNQFGRDERDPKVFWHAPDNKWVMLLWLDRSARPPERFDFGFFASTDLKNWELMSTFNFPGVIETPDFFQLPLDGDAARRRWIFWAGAGRYFIGDFDGERFTPESGPFSIRGATCFAATQTFNHVPGDARRILIVHGTAKYPGMPFNNQMNFPLELTLRSTPAGVRVHANPVAELALLRVSTNFWPAQTLATGRDVMAGTTGEAFELEAVFALGATNAVTFDLRGTTVTYDCRSNTVSCAGFVQPLAPVAGVVRLRLLVDRGLIEIFGNDGRLYMPVKVPPLAGERAVSLATTGEGTRLASLAMYRLGSAWRKPADVGASGH